MKKITFLFILYSSFLYSQEEINIIYVDNHSTLNQFELIQAKLTPLVNSEFLLYISDGDSPEIITSKTSYDDKIRRILLTQTSRPSLNMEIKYLNNQIKKYYNNELEIGRGVKATTKVNLYFFFDMDTYCGYDLHKDFVNKILLIYKLRTVDGVKSNCNITYNIFNNYDKECELTNDKQITLNKY